MTFLAPAWSERLGYSAMNDRQLIASLLQPGVMESGAMKCSAGSGFQSTIAAGRAAIEGTFQTAQGLYVVQNAGIASVTHPTPSPTLPRIDQIGAKVYDSVDGGDVSDKCEPLVLEGTPTSGATLVNKLGIATVPTNFLRFAYVLVPAAAGSAASFSYEDARTGPGIVKYLEGTLAARPAAGLQGRVYFATDAEVYYCDTGKAWNVIGGKESVSATTLAQIIAEEAGINVGATKRRGHTNIATEQSVTSTTYTTLATPDAVTVTLPSNGLILVWFQAMFKESVSKAGIASLFLSGTEVKNADLNEGAPLKAFGANAGSASGEVWKAIYSSTHGLGGANEEGGGLSYTGDVTTGQVVGGRTLVPLTGGSPATLSMNEASGMCSIFAAAGTYTVEVRVKSTSGSVTMKNRKLWVMALGF